MIICCGEALIDMIPVDDADGNKALCPVSGGAIFNTAIGLGRLGVETAMVTGLSEDLFGNQLADDLHKSGVSTDLAIRSNRPSTLAFVELIDGKATYSFYDENTAGRMIRPEDLPEMPTEVNAFYFGGISLCAEPAAETYLALAERVHKNCVLMLDPNIRPGFIDDEQAYRARLEKMIGLADIVKVSDEDLEWIVPENMDESERVKKLSQSNIASGPSLVIVTRGEEGVSAYLSSGATISVESQKVEVVDTVGAGDTFNAGVLESLFKTAVLTKSNIQTANTETLEQALRRGAEVASVTVTRVGANPPWAKEVG